MNENPIHAILSKLGVDSHTNVSDKISGKDIADFEAKYELSLPTVYREYLLKYGAVWFDIDVEYTPIVQPPSFGDKTSILFGGFYGLNEVIEATEQYAGRIPNALIPITDDMGDLLCIGVGGDVFGKIYYWEHEDELVAKLMVGIPTHTENIDEYWDNLYLVSNSFVDFLNGLRIV